MGFKSVGSRRRWETFVATRLTNVQSFIDIWYFRLFYQVWSNITNQINKAKQFFVYVLLFASLSLSHKEGDSRVWGSEFHLKIQTLSSDDDWRCNFVHYSSLIFEFFFSNWEHRWATFKHYDDIKNLRVFTTPTPSRAAAPLLIHIQVIWL